MGQTFNIGYHTQGTDYHREQTIVCLTIASINWYWFNTVILLWSKECQQRPQTIASHSSVDRGGRGRLPPTATQKKFVGKLVGNVIALKQLTENYCRVLWVILFIQWFIQANFSHQPRANTFDLVVERIIKNNYDFQ